MKILKTKWPICESMCQGENSLFHIYSFYGASHVLFAAGCGIFLLLDNFDISF